MMRQLAFLCRCVVGALCAGFALVAGCASTEPDKLLQPLTGLSVPASAGFRDTVRVAFFYNGCGITPQLDISMRRARVDVAVWISRSDVVSPCLAISSLVRTEFLLPPEYRGPVETAVVFHQPGGADSVRTVMTEAAATHAISDRS